jgi:hypothetical protein
MNNMKRRDFLKFSGLGLAGLTLSGINFPVLKTQKAFAYSDAAWKFGVMADTQWRIGANAGGEPASCATTIIDALNNQFIQHDCKFVIQVGDLVDVESVSGVRTLPTRAAHAQALYDAGIGFFPVRGNHEGTRNAALEIRALFPQTQGGGTNLFGAANFQSPILATTATDPLGERLKGLSYAFDFNNVRCVLIDQFTRADNTNYNNSTNNNAVDQVTWVDDALFSNPVDNHSFVFAHKNLIGQNHKDVLFGGNLTSNAGPRDAFISSLCSNEAGYFLSGHDHMHHRSIVKSTDGNSKVNQIICSSNSYKFYIPAPGDDGRETPLDQELFTIGYYIFTIDGPRVTVDFYSSSHGSDYGDYDLIMPPGFSFYLRESCGYSLNGKKFEVAHGGSYAGILDTYQDTKARILSGSNGNTETDRLGRPLIKTVNTGWSDSETVDGAASKILTLWGIADNLSLYDGNLTGLLPDQPESKQGDVYTLSVSYDPKKVRPSQLVSGRLVLASKDVADGNWTKAVDLNYGGIKTFKYGPWKAQYGLGTYGVDPSSSTIWAVINHEGDFVAKLI